MSERLIVLPDDAYNRELISHVHPPDWENPEPAPVYNLLVVGLGTAGLVTAVGAASMGAKVALVENYLIGGDCLNFGCVPSKAVIRSARAKHEIERAALFGIDVQGDVEVDFPRVMERMRSLRARISRHDSQQRLTKLGVHLFLGEGKFRDRTHFVVEGKTLRFRKAAITTGARPAIPDIPGLEDAGYLTSETVFSLTEKPERLVVIGGGPQGCELAQAFHRLGSRVTIVQHGPQVLPREDPDAAQVLARVFQEEGIRILLNSEVHNAVSAGDVKELEVTTPAGKEMLAADEVLAAVGRIPNVDSLDMEAAGIEYDLTSGIKINSYLQTSNPRVYAAGDVCFPYQFTHMADATARIVIQNALFLRSKKHTALTIPWCTYTDPEVAHVGLYEREIKEQGLPYETFTREFKEIDRAILDSEEEGFLKVHVRKGKDKILGATLVGSHAGDVLSQITQAMVAGMGLKALNNVIHPYPIRSEAVRQTASLYYVNKFSPRIQYWLGHWFRLRR